MDVTPQQKQSTPLHKLEPSPAKTQLKHRNTRYWCIALLFAMIVHLAALWLPISLPAYQKKTPRTIQLAISQIPAPTPPPPAVSTPPQPKIPKTKPPPRPQRKLKRQKIRKPPVKRLIARAQRPTPPRTIESTAASENIPDPPAQSAAKIEARPPILPPPPPPPPPPKIHWGVYTAKLFAQIERHKQYPRMARRMRHEGVVVLTLQVDTHGKLVRPPIIQRSSGFDILDREAIRMVQAASPLPPLPKEFTKASISFNVPIRFSLR